MGRFRLHLQSLAAFAVTLCGALFAFLPASALAVGCTESWVAGGSGSWNVAANWSGGAIPGAGDNVCIQQAGTYTVSLPSAVTIGSLTVGNSSGGGVQTLLVASGGGSLTVQGA